LRLPLILSYALLIDHYFIKYPINGIVLLPVSMQIAVVKKHSNEYSNNYKLGVKLAVKTASFRF
jgi:hypothetical protein